MHFLYENSNLKNLATHPLIRKKASPFCKGGGQKQEFVEVKNAKNLGTATRYIV